MSLRRCMTWSTSLLTRHAVHHHALLPSTSASTTTFASTNIFLASSPSSPLNASRLPTWRHQSVRRNHDETDNINTKAVIEVINQSSGDDVDPDNLMVKSFNPTGFKLTNQYGIVGPCILFPKTILSWNVRNALDITPESLVIFSLLEPKLEMVVIGFGNGRHLPDRKRIISFFKRLGINVEILATEEACATFNFLNAEQRHVAAALIPPEDVTLFTPEVWNTDLFFENKGELDLAATGPEDFTNPRNWDNPKYLTDYVPDSEKSEVYGLPIIAKHANEMRITEAAMKDEIDAMEDRYTPDGEKVTTELEERAKRELKADYLEAGDTGVVSPRIEYELDYQENKIDIVDNYRSEYWDGIDKSQRFRKKFDKLYTLPEDDPQELLEEGKGQKMLMGEEKLEEDGGESELRSGTETEKLQKPVDDEVNSERKT